MEHNSLNCFFVDGNWDTQGMGEGALYRGPVCNMNGLVDVAGSWRCRWLLMGWASLFLRASFVLSSPI